MVFPTVVTPSAWRKTEPLAHMLDFGHTADLLTRYDAELVSVSKPGADGHRTFTVALKPKRVDVKKGTDEFVLSLTASTRDYFPGDATLRVGRSSIRTVFEHVRINEDPPADAFRFAPPAGADVFQSPEPNP
jgi:outer membrane lipoprotein-sorting protein